jgi:hypothetical protein
VTVWGAPRNGGVFLSPGVRGPWTHLGEGLEGREVLALTQRDGSILAGTDDGVFVRAPRARAWVRLSTRVDGVDVHPRVTELLALPSLRLLGATPDGLILSSDGGRTWIQPGDGGSAGEVFCMAQSHVELNLIVAATRSGLLRSTDGGATWSKVSSDLDAVTPHEIAFMPFDDRALFATTSGGLFSSRDQGTTWQRVGGGIPHSDLDGIAIGPDGRTIYASDFTRGGIFRSVDGGTTWNRMPTEGLASDRVWTLALDPAAPERLLAASSAGGLHLLVTTSTVTSATVDP